MTTQPASNHRVRIGIIFYGKKIWFSELISFFIVCILLTVLSWVTIVIFQKASTIRSLNQDIAALKIEKVLINHRVTNLREKNQITSLLCLHAGKRVKPKTLLHLSDIIYKNSKQFGYDPMLVLAVIQVESYFDPQARGRYQSGAFSGALGLMQIKFATAKEVAKWLQIDSLQREDLFKAEINLVLGVAYLTRLISDFQSFKLGIIAYNRGPYAIKKSLSRNIPLSVRYYEKVLNSYYRLKNISDNDSLHLQPLDCR